MERIEFKIAGQDIAYVSGKRDYAGETVAYIEAVFDLDSEWLAFDSVRAVFESDYAVISAVLDAENRCVIPTEVLTKKSLVNVNLVGSVADGDVLTERLTTYQTYGLTIRQDVPIEGSETAPVTPSQFEQYIEIVRSLVDSVKDIDHIELNPDYTLTIYYSDGTSFTTTSIRGEAGNGIESCILNADYTLTINYTDGTSYTTTSIRGAKGDKGDKGDTGNGISSIEKTSTSGRVDTYTITFTDGTTTTFTVTNGEVTYADLSTLLPTDTASGSIASFPDGQSVIPALSVIADIEPIQSGSGTPSPDNVRPISGRTECVMSRCGKNFIKPYEHSNKQNGVTFTMQSDGGVRIQGTATANAWVHNSVSGPTHLFPLHSGNYFLSGNTVGASNGVNLYLVNAQSNNATNYDAGNGRALSLPSSDYYIQVMVSNGATVDAVIYPQLELGSTASSYEPYEGDTYTTDLGRTVYGGTLDVVNGELTVTDVPLAFDNTAWTYNSGGFFYRNVLNAGDNVSNYYMTENGVTMYLNGNNGQARIYLNDNPFLTSESDIGALLNGYKLVYELAEPQTYQLTPQEVDLLLGQNNIWTDCGEVEVTYKADVGLYIDKRLNA